MTVDVGVVGWSERGLWLPVIPSNVLITLDGINQAIIRADQRLCDAYQMTGIGFVDQSGTISTVYDDWGIINSYLSGMLGDLSSLIDHPLFLGFSHGATENLSQVRSEDITTANTVGLQGVSYGGSRGYTPPHYYTLPSIGLDDMAGVGEAVDGVEGFDEVFHESWEEWKATVPEDEQMSFNEYVTGILTSGEYDHTSYHPVADFFTGFLDFTIIWPIYKSVTGFDPIAGEDLSDWERSVGVVMAFVDLGGLIAALPSGGGSLAGTTLLKASLRAVGRELLINALATGTAMLTFDLAVELGLPQWLAALTAMGVGVTITVKGTTWNIQRLDTNGIPTGPPIEIPINHATSGVSLPHGAPTEIAQSPAFRSAQATRDLAAAARPQAVADLQRAKNTLEGLLPPGTPPIPNLTVGNIDSIAAGLRLDYPDLATEIEALRKLAWAERGSLTSLRNASDALGMQAARDAIEGQGGQVLIDGTTWPSTASGQLPGTAQKSGANTFDVVGLSEDGSTMLIIEAKGGGSQLSPTGRVVGHDAAGNPVRAPQGSVEYLNDLLAKDPNLNDLFAADPDLVHGLRDGRITIDYQVARAPGNGTATLTPLPIDPNQIDLDFLGP